MPHDSLLSAAFGNHSAPHFHQHWSVGISCLFLSAPLPLFFAHGDTLLACFNMLVTACSVMADYLYINTVCDDVDRFVAASYIAYLLFLSFLNNGTLWTIANFTFLVLTPFCYSRNSRSKEQWQFRHALWHYVCGLNQVLIMYGVYHASKQLQ
uniref:Uncharacterized protein n=1 Tax=Tetraselmis chuii TaxID=63592 RepID=A0A7S1T8X2_9CHLO|mmetsp:Transcript_8615/g.15567  ORF Transcript_8615/g.15567 Transcript_8615/m.15567 type:complete len:153 (+) Transcript_8615:127-585(+)